MASSTGGYVGLNSGFALRVDMTSGGTISGKTTVGWSLYLVAGKGVDDDNNTLEISGNASFSGAVDAYLPTGGGVQLLKSGSVTVDPGLGSSATVTISASLTGLNYFGSSYKATVAISQKFTRPALKPSKPGKPTVSSITATGCKVAMTTPSSNGSSITDTGFWIYKAASGGTAVWSDGVVSTATTATASGLTRATDYWAEVKAKNGVGWSDPSDRVKFTTSTAKPSVPGATSASGITATSMKLSWAASSDNGGLAVTYRWKCGSKSGTTTGTSVTVSGLTRATSYETSVQAENGAGVSGYTAVRKFTTAATEPDKPAKPTLTDVAATSLTVGYTAPANGGSTIAGWQAQIATNSSFTAGVRTVTATSASAASVAIGALTPGTDYWVRVAATNGIGTSDWSDAATTRTLSGVKTGNDDGTAWVDALVYVGTGSAWALAEVRSGNGTGWVV